MAIGGASSAKDNKTVQVSMISFCHFGKVDSYFFNTHEILG